MAQPVQQKDILPMSKLLIYLATVAVAAAGWGASFGVLSVQGKLSDKNNTLIHQHALSIKALSKDIEYIRIKLDEISNQLNERSQ